MVESMQWMVRETGKCANCKKTFFKTFGGDWGYSYRQRECCSYHCMRALERADKNSYLHIKEEQAKAEKRKNEERQAQLKKLDNIRRNEQVEYTHFISNSEKEIIMRMWIAGKTVRDIEEITQRSGHAIRRVLKEEGLRMPQKRTTGRLTDEQIQQIREMAQRGMSNKAIANVMGVCLSTVCNHKK